MMMMNSVTDENKITLMRHGAAALQPCELLEYSVISVSKNEAHKDFLSARRRHKS